MARVKKYVFKTNVSQFNLNILIEETVSDYKSPEILELLFMLGGKVKKHADTILYSGCCKPGGYEELRLKFTEILVKLGGCDPNKLIYINGIYSSVTCLTMLCSSKDEGYKNYNVIAKLVELGGDMSIKDNKNNSAYDYLDDYEVLKLSKLIPNFKYDYDLYKSANKYNL